MKLSPKRFEQILPKIHMYSDLKKNDKIFSYFLPQIEEFKEILRLESIEFFVTTVLSAILVTKRAVTLRLREHQANCRNQKQHSAVVRSFMGFQSC